MELSENQLNSLLKNLVDKNELYSVPLEMFEIVQNEINCKIDKMKPKISALIMNTSLGHHDYSPYSDDHNIVLLKKIFENLEKLILNHLIKD